jgi:hypothetical protein
MSHIRSYSLAALLLVAAGAAAEAQIPGSFSPTPTASITLQAQKNESFAMTLSSTVQAGPLTIADSTAGASQPFSGSLVLTPTWDLANNRQVEIYGYVSSAFTTGSVSLASSLLEASATGGTGSANGSWNPFSATVDGHASAVSLTSLTVSGASKKVTGTSERLTVGFRLNTTNTYVDPGLYTGVVTFAARVQ